MKLCSMMTIIAFIYTSTVHVYGMQPTASAASAAAACVSADAAVKPNSSHVSALELLHQVQEEQVAQPTQEGQRVSIEQILHEVASLRQRQRDAVVNDLDGEETAVSACASGKEKTEEQFSAEKWSILVDFIKVIKGKQESGRALSSEEIEHCKLALKRLLGQTRMYLVLNCNHLLKILGEASLKSVFIEHLEEKGDFRYVMDSPFFPQSFLRSWLRLQLLGKDYIASFDPDELLVDLNFFNGDHNNVVFVIKCFEDFLAAQGGKHYMEFALVKVLLSTIPRIQCLVLKKSLIDYIEVKINGWLSGSSSEYGPNIHAFDHFWRGSGEKLGDEEITDMVARVLGRRIKMLSV